MGSTVRVRVTGWLPQPDADAKGRRIHHMLLLLSSHPRFHAGSLRLSWRVALQQNKHCFCRHDETVCLLLESKHAWVLLDESDRLLSWASTLKTCLYFLHPHGMHCLSSQDLTRDRERGSQKS